MSNEWTRAWEVGQGLTLSLLKAVPAASLESAYAERTRSVGSQFAHLHSARVDQLRRRGRAFVGELTTFPRGARPGKRELQRALGASAAAVARMLDAFAERGHVPSWKDGPLATYVGYLLSHEAHHRGLVLVALRVAGRRLPAEVTMGLWSGWSKAGPG